MRFARVLLSVGMIASLAACTHRWDPDPELGSSVRSLRAAQYLNPNAPYGVAAPVGMDGPAAQSTIKVYQKSFESPSKGGVNTSMSGGSGGGSGSTGGSGQSSQ